jgi:hypothetical protein
LFLFVGCGIQRADGLVWFLVNVSGLVGSGRSSSSTRERYIHNSLVFFPFVSSCSEYLCTALMYVDCVCVHEFVSAYVDVQAGS